MTCSSFLSSFSLIVFIKFFLIQKSNSSINLNPKEEKQEEATINYSTSISDSLGKNISSVIHPWDNFPGGQFSLGSIVPGAIIHATNHPKGNFLWGKFSRDKLSGISCLCDNLLRVNYLGRISGAIIRGAITQGAILRTPTFLWSKFFSIKTSPLSWLGNNSVDWFLNYELSFYYWKEVPWRR